MKFKIKSFLLGLVPSMALAIYLGMGSASTSFLKEICDDLATFSKSSKGISVYTKVYDHKDSLENLGSNLNQLGYQPLQITVRNNSSHTLILREDQVSLNNAPSKAIVWKITKKGIPRSVAFRVASIFFWPMSIPSTIDTINGFKVHSKLSKELAAKSLKDEEIILPYSSLNRVVYIKSEEFSTNYTVMLEDVTTGQHLEFESPVQ